MGTGIRRFEDLEVWQLARVLTAEIYQLTRQGAWAKDFGHTGQIQRAAVSIMNNVAEGFERWNPREFSHFLSIAKGSCAEVRSLLYVALDAGYLDQHRFDELLPQFELLGGKLGALRARVSRRGEG